MGLAWTKKILRSSEKVNDLWGMYSPKVLRDKSLEFQMLLKRNSPDSPYHAINFLAGSYIAQALVNNGSIKDPTSLQAPPTTVRKRKEYTSSNSDDEANSYLKRPRRQTESSQPEYIELD